MAYDNGRLFVTNYDATVVAFDAASGAQLWAAASADVGGGEPIAIDGVVYVQGSQVYARSEATGQTKWISPVLSGFANALAVDTTGVYVNGDCSRWRLSVASGSVIWRDDNGCYGGTGSASYLSDGLFFAETGHLIVSATDGARQGTFAGKPAFDGGDVYLAAGATLSSETTSSHLRHFSTTLPSQIVAGPVISNGVVYVGTADAKIYQVHTITGQIMANRSLPGPPGDPSGQPPGDYTGTRSDLGVGDGLLVVPTGSTVTAFGEASTVPTAPAFTADIPPASATVGIGYTYPFTASGVPAPTFALASGTLPAGLTLDATTGVLSGIPTTTGSSDFTVLASNGTHPNAVSPTLVISVTAPPVAGDGFHPLTPARILDSRPGGPEAGPYSTPWAPGQTRDVAVTGVGGVPAGADAVVINVTVTNTTDAGYLTIWPAGQPQPLAANLIWSARQSLSNAVTLKVGNGGNTSIFSSAGNVDVIADVAGSFASGSGHLFHPLTPARVLDSRPAGPQGGPYRTPWAAGQTRDVAVTGVGGVPFGADAVVINVTVTNTTDAGYLTVWPAGQPPPLAANLIWSAGQSISNAVSMKVGVTGKMSVFNPAGKVDVIADTAGYYS